MDEITDRTCPVCQTRSFRPLFEHRDPLHGRGGTFMVIACDACRLVSYDPLPDAATLASYYPVDYYAHQGSATDVEEPQGWRRLLDDVHLGLRRSLPLKLILWPLLCYKDVYSYARFLRPVRRGRLLDVGCGDGAFLLKAHRMGFDCTGLEPGGHVAERLRRAGIPVLNQSLDALEPGAGPFDVITLNHVFEHLLAPEAALRRLRGLLAPEGRLLIRMPNTGHFLFHHFARHLPQLEMPRHVYLYTAANFTRLAARCGLDVESVEQECFPLHMQQMLKAALFGRRFNEPHWTDNPLISFALLPLCDAMKWVGQGDCLALWLRPARTEERQEAQS